MHRHGNIARDIGVVRGILQVGVGIWVRRRTGIAVVIIRRTGRTRDRPRETDRDMDTDTIHRCTYPYGDKLHR